MGVLRLRAKEGRYLIAILDRQNMGIGAGIGQMAVPVGLGCRYSVVQVYLLGVATLGTQNA